MERIGVVLVLALGAAACQERALGISEPRDGGGADLRAQDLSGVDQSIVVDLAGSPTDASMFPPGDLSGLEGVDCVDQTCPVGAQCCVRASAGGGLSGSCIVGGSCSDGGIPLGCDGPEDCPTDAPSCCAAVALGGGGQPMGAATCAASCPGMATIGGGMGMGGGGKLSTKLCHSATDCAGYTGTAPVLGMTSFGSCCGLPGVSFQVCAPALLGSIGGATCN